MLKEKTSDVSMTNTNQGSGTTAEAAVPMSHGLWNTWLKNLLLFCLTGVYVELCLHLCVFGSMDRYAGYPVLFGLLGGALCTLVVSSLPKVLRQITGVFLVAAQVLLAEVQLVYHCIFGDFMPVSQIGMGGNVVVNFNSQLLYGIRQNLLKILLLLLPLIAVILCLALRRGQALKLRLEEAGVADKTCIVLTNDHYPYGLTEDEYNELAGQTLDTTFEKYRNSFICYVPGLSENIVVDEYCSTADILPTLLNLFGVDYDSRLLAGTDVLSSGIHAAVLSDKSFLTKTFRYDAGTETVIPADENTTVSGKLAEAYRLYVDSRFQLSGNILNSDYYAHVFARESSGGSLADTVVFTDIKSIFNQASVLYMYRKGYVEPEAPDTFGGKATARLGEFIDVLYRIAGRPETDNTALPADYENEEFNAAHPYYNAVCWAYQTRLLRQNDPNTEYDDKVDYQTACVLIRRYAIMAGVDTGVDQTQLRQLLRDAPDLGREAAKAMLWCDEKDITTRDSSLDELLASAGTRISRYQMTSFLFYLCTYELDIGS